MEKFESVLVAAGRERPVPIHVLAQDGWAAFRKTLSARQRTWAESNNFTADGLQRLLLPGEDGKLAGVVASFGEGADPFQPGTLARLLPAGLYVFRGNLPSPALAALGWCLESYDFDRYRASAKKPARLVCPASAGRDAILSAAGATAMVRDMINTPAADMGPDEIEKAARDLARRHRARVSVTKGKALERGFPMIHAVGRASNRAPRLIDLAWGPARGPRVTLVGKGVCFDTGGIDIKPASNMLLMKKDMGGAATVLGLARMIMESGLAVRLRVLIPAVENAISGNAFRPGDVLRSRKGLAVEIGNTDAEGRLVLADALALADEEAPDLLIDMATLTGAARVALGPDLPPFYTDDDRLARAIMEAADAENDPLWRMPLWRPYRRLIETPLADINNSSESGYAGSVTAALFLRRFVEQAKSYVHFDIFGWTPSPRPCRPRGGEAQAMRAMFRVIEGRARG
jgi:leucyl aminopeptidase